MTRRPAQDGAHTVFTDHRIMRRPELDELVSQSEELKAWRDPEPALQARNLALAYVNAGISGRSPAEIARGYRMLTEVQRATPDDVAVLKGIGLALLTGGKPIEALKAFEWVLKLTPNSATSEEDVGLALLQSGQIEKAGSYFERALELDPLLLSAGTALQAAYRKQGNEEKADALGDRMRRTMLNLPKKSGR
jgi:tetratricopeptide (TPR) repeat protein